MTTEDDDKPRKKISVTRPADSTAPRKRSGARARQVAQQSFRRTRTPEEQAATSAKRDAGVERSKGPSVHRMPSQRDNRQRDAGRSAFKSVHNKPAINPKPTDKTDKLFHAFATCPQGLEEVLAEELKRLEFAKVEPRRSGCAFKTDSQGILRANLYSRLATRILLQVAQAKILTEDELYELAAATPWENWFGPEHSLRVDTSAIRSPMKSLQFCNLRVKDGICDRLRRLEGERPSIDTVRPDAKVQAFLFENQATLYLDSSGESLFKRGWRLAKGSAPIRENLAAGMLALSGWQPGETLLDPFCGSGTILIEAALMTQNVPPGILRPFQFERWRGFERSVWKNIKEQAFAEIQSDRQITVFGSDKNPAALDAVRLNMQRARLSDQAIQLEQKNILDIQAPAETGFIVCNPPYNERLDDEIDSLWHPWSGVLKQQFANWEVALITSDRDLPRKLRLKPTRKYPLYNGDIECRLFKFQMVASGYRDA